MELNNKTDLEVVICEDVGFSSGFKGSNPNRMFVKDQAILDQILQEMETPRMSISMEYRKDVPKISSPGSIYGCGKEEVKWNGVNGS